MTCLRRRNLSGADAKANTGFQRKASMNGLTDQISLGMGISIIRWKKAGEGV